MSDRIVPGPLRGNPGCKEACAIHTMQIYDSCRAKDCLEDLRVYLSHQDQCILDKSVNVKLRRAELIYAFSEVEEVPFNPGCFAVDVRFCYKVYCDICGCNGRPTEISGLAMHDKRVILYGSQGNVHIFSSESGFDCSNLRRNLPTAVVEAVDPIALGCKVIDSNDCVGGEIECELPECLGRFFSDEFVFSGDEKRLLVTLGQFSIIRLERDSQLLIPCFDFCLPEKTCPNNEENPCDLFSRIQFPVDEFCPPVHPNTACGCVREPEPRNGCGERDRRDFERREPDRRESGRRGCNERR